MLLSLQNLATSHVLGLAMFQLSGAKLREAMVTQVSKTRSLRIWKNSTHPTWDTFPIHNMLLEMLHLKPSFMGMGIIICIITVVHNDATSY